MNKKEETLPKDFKPTMNDYEYSGPKLKNALEMLEEGKQSKLITTTINEKIAVSLKDKFTQQKNNLQDPKAAGSSDNQLETNMLSAQLQEQIMKNATSMHDNEKKSRSSDE